MKTPKSLKAWKIITISLFIFVVIISIVLGITINDGVDYFNYFLTITISLLLTIGIATISYPSYVKFIQTLIDTRKEQR